MKPILSRAEFVEEFELTKYELELLLRRPDFVRLCCLATEDGTVTRIVPGQVKRWLEEGDWSAATEASKAPNLWAVVAVVCEAVLRVVRRPGGIEKAA